MSAGFVLGVVEDYDPDGRTLTLIAPDAEPLVLGLAHDFDAYPAVALGGPIGFTASVLVSGDGTDWTAVFAMLLPEA